MDVVSKLRTTFLLLGSVICCTACDMVPKPLPTDTHPNTPQQGVANPATQKCIQDGHTSKPILSSAGVPIGHLCVNQGNGKKCEEWAYFRGECSLKPS